MSLLPEEFLKSVVSIKTDSMGWTAFLYWVKLKKIDEISWENHYAVFLITNRHMVNIDKSLIIRYNKKNWGVGETTIEKWSDWIFPNEATIDLAIIQVNADYLKENEVDYVVFWQENSILSEDEFLLKLKIWQDIFLAGFPLWIIWIEKNYPIARQWIIARNDIELLKKWIFYLDVNNFPWNSWWPIFLKPSNMSLTGKNPMDKALFIWVICAYEPFPRTLYDNSQFPPVPMMITYENSWIALWVPIYIAYELAKEWIEKQWEEVF